MRVEKLDLVLVNPGSGRKGYGNISSSFRGIEPPVWCGLIAGFIRNLGYSVRIIDADALNWTPEYTAKKIAGYNPILAGIIVLGTNPAVSSTPKMPVARKILLSLKKNAAHIKTILAGLHPSALPEQTLKEEQLDFVGQGECFYTILGLLKMLKSAKKMNIGGIDGLWYKDKGKIVSNPSGLLIENLDELPFAAWDLLPMDKYRAHNWHCFANLQQRQPYAVIWTSLGCPFSCSYCPIHAFYGKPGIRFRSPEKVVEEIAFLVKNFGVKNIKILDELFTLKEERVSRICDLIIEGGYNLNIWAYARIDTVNHAVLKKMKQAGINWLAFGIESANYRVRRDINKKIEQDKIKKVVAMAHELNINLIGNFIFGLPYDSLKTLRQTLDFAKELKFEYVNFYTAVAYPGSQLYKDALQKGIKLPQDWSGYSQYSPETLPLPTRYLSGLDVLHFRDNAFKEYFSNPEYLKIMQKKFGEGAVQHIKEMLKNQIQRRN